jgi:6-pyruvoyltetrahydropterin/6-carboxytetrahydropterin synthase
MFTISKRFSFAASHQLDGLPAGHPCTRLHGHNYTVQVDLAAADLDPAGMVYDYGALAPLAGYLAAELDHRHLNDRLAVNPTAEQLARHLYEQAAKLLPGAPLVAVGVSETPRTWAWYTP